MTSFLEGFGLSSTWNAIRAWKLGEMLQLGLVEVRPDEN
jgi:hypothetical protein